MEKNRIEELMSFIWEAPFVKPIVRFAITIFVVRAVNKILS